MEGKAEHSFSICTKDSNNDNDRTDDSPTTTVASTISSAECHDLETLWIGDIPTNATVQDVTNTFCEYGEILDVQIKRTSDFAKFPLNYAFVKFSVRSSADNAYSDLSLHPEKCVVVVNGSTSNIRLGWAKTNTTLHVGNLDLNTNLESLIKLFSPFGELCTNPTDGKVTGVVIHKNSHNMNTNSIYATVTFTNRDNADDARVATNGCMLGTRPIKGIHYLLNNSLILLFS